MDTTKGLDVIPDYSMGFYRSILINGRIKVCDLLVGWDYFLDRLYFKKNSIDNQIV